MTATERHIAQASCRAQGPFVPREHVRPRARRGGIGCHCLSSWKCNSPPDMLSLNPVGLGIFGAEKLRAMVRPSRTRTTASSVILVVLLPLLGWGILSFLSWPLAPDPSIHLTGVHQGVLNEMGLGQMWTFRGPVYNAYLLLLYSIVEPFVSFYDKLAFDMGVKLVHLSVYLAATTFWGYSLARNHRQLRAWALPAVGVVLLGFLSPTRNFWLHAEDVALLVLIISSGFSFHRRSGLLICGGLVASLLPLIKGVTVVLCITAFAVMWLNRTRTLKEVLFWIAGFTAGALVQAYLCLTIWAVPLQDLFDAAVFQGAALPTAGRRWAFLLEEWPKYFELTPLFVPSIALTPLVLGQLVAERRWGSATALATSWLGPMIMVIAQHHYFFYHFGCALFPATLVLLLFLSTPIQGWCSKASLAPVMAIPFAIWLTDHPFFSDHVGYRTAFLGVLVLSVGLPFAHRLPGLTRLEYQVLTGATVVSAFVFCWTGGATGFAFSDATRLRHAQTTLEARLRHLEDEFGLAGEKVLLLSYGVISRNLRMSSACRHFFPIPVQRFRSDDSGAFEAAPSFRENLDCITDFRGRYIALERKWMYRSDLAPEMKKWLRSYRRVAWLDEKKRIALLERRSGRPGGSVDEERFTRRLVPL